MILKFKPLENSNNLQFNCNCLVGTMAPIDYNDFLQKLKDKKIEPVIPMYLRPSYAEK